MKTKITQRLGLLGLLLLAALILSATGCTKPLVQATDIPSKDARTKRSEPINDSNYRKAHKLPVK